MIASGGFAFCVVLFGTEDLFQKKSHMKTLYLNDERGISLVERLNLVGHLSPPRRLLGNLWREARNIYNKGHEIRNISLKVSFLDLTV